MDSLAITILDTLDRRAQISPPSAARADFGLDEAYRIADQVMTARCHRGEHVAGWKIGFTNSSIWDEYGVHAPIWGPMYAAGITARDAGEIPSLDAAGFVEPRIEPEIVLRVAVRPRAGMSDVELLGCIDAVGHGFEIVQSIYPDWKFAAADTVACGALHGAFVHGPLLAVQPADHTLWLKRLAGFSIELSRNDAPVDRGVAANVLGGPLSALRHFVDGMAAMPMQRGIEPGDLVTTGTVTRAFPVRKGELWSTTVEGLPVDGASIAFT